MGLMDLFTNNGSDFQLKGKDLFSFLLTKCNCEFAWEQEESFVRTEFSYQGGNFQLRVFDDSSAFLYFVLKPIEISKLHAIQNLANRLNRYSKYVCMVYDIDDRTNMVDIWLTYAFMNIPDETQMLLYFKAVLNECFQALRYFDDETAKLKDGDVTMNNYIDNRIKYLVFEQELNHNSIGEDSRENLPICSSSEYEISLSSVLQTLFQLDIKNIQQVKILEKDNVSVITNKDDIRNIYIWRLLCNTLGKEATFTIDSITLFVDTYDEQHVTLTLQQLFEDEKRLYARISGYLQSPIHTLDGGIYEKANSVFHSICIAYDKMTDGDRSAEYEFIVKEATEKLQQNKTSELTPEQKLIAENDLIYPSRDFYYGKKFFAENRYFESLYYLKRCYGQMQSNYQTLKDNEKKLFFSVCYMIGFCYDELEQYENANMYLQIAATERHMTYTMEYVNCLVNSKDFRAGAIIDSILSEIYSNYTKQEYEEDEILAEFVDFLRRRRVYVCIDLGDLDIAEKQLKEMLKEPKNEKYALKELAYIQQLKERGKNNH